MPPASSTCPTAADLQPQAAAHEGRPPLRDRGAGAPRGDDVALPRLRGLPRGGRPGQARTSCSWTRPTTATSAPTTACPSTSATSDAWPGAHAAARAGHGRHQGHAPHPGPVRGRVLARVSRGQDVHVDDQVAQRAPGDPPAHHELLTPARPSGQEDDHDETPISPSHRRARGSRASCRRRRSWRPSASLQSRRSAHRRRPPPTSRSRSWPPRPCSPTWCPDRRRPRDGQPASSPRAARSTPSIPRPRDAVRFAEADLVVMNGLGLDDWLRKLVTESGAASAPLVALGRGPGVDYLAGEAADAAPRARGAAWDGRGAEGVASPQPAHVDGRGQRDEVRGQADRRAGNGRSARTRGVRRACGGLPRPAAPLDAEIAAHDGGHPGGATHGRLLPRRVPLLRGRVRPAHRRHGHPQPRPGAERGGCRRLIDTIRREGVSAIFAESQFPNDLVDTIGSETGVAGRAGLYDDTLAMRRWTPTRA